jgi:endonuclease YncB( thermonuclease family)
VPPLALLGVGPYDPRMSEHTFGPYAGVIDLVHDGDTVNVKLDVGFDLTVYARVRVFGINAPEISTPEGKVAREFAKALLKPGEPVRVVSYGWDKYGGRIDGSIEYGLAGDPHDFAKTMIDSGHAKPYFGKGQKPT